MTGGVDRRRHWERVYRERGPDRVSWYESEPLMSLAMLDLAGMRAGEGVLDVGGGASPLAATLLERGVTDVSVLDISACALQASRARLGEAASRVEWIRADVLDWTPSRTYGIWHDRAVFHFLVEPESRERYLATARSAVPPGGRLVIGCFAEDGPEMCSGLAVTRYDARALADAVGSAFTLICSRRHHHRTPGGALQAFTWAVLEKTRPRPS